MVAAVELGNNGEAAFASLRVPAWHGLGTVVQEEVTPEEMLKLAHLDNWNVRALDLDSLLPPSVEGNSYDRKQVIVRNNPFYDPEVEGSLEYQRLGVTGDKYVIGQNEEMSEIMALVGARPETAGSLFGGTQVFMTGALERDIIIDAEGVNDVIKMYLMFYTSHNGSSKFCAAITPIRVVCANTLQVARGNMKPVIEVRHSANFHDRMADAKATVDLQVKYTEQFGELAGDLFEAPVTDQEFFNIVNLAFPEKPDAKKNAVTRRQNKIDDVMGLWDGKTQEGIKGTGWGAFNALTEDQQWNRKIYKGNTEKFYAAGAGLDDAVNRERNRLLDLVASRVLV